MEDVLLKIDKAEKTAAQTIENAKQAAAKKAADTKVKCDKIFADKTAAAQAKAKEISDDAKNNAHGLYNRISSGYDNKCDDCEKRAAAKMDAAIDAIIKSIV